jgi:cellulose synthase/poly-beta-1,6-N-acetylglucosamine synthase-like glycosyltransferase
MEFAEVIFWIGLAVPVYSLVGYPLLMLFLGRAKRPIAEPSVDPVAVSVVICAFNEEAVIADKIRNTLALDCPNDRTQIIVVSDGSTDRTNEIVESFNDARLEFVSYAERGGKVKAINTAVARIRGSVTVFTDANVMVEPDAVRRLVAALEDVSVGCAVGNVILRAPDGTARGEGVYSRYEKAVHTAEGNWRTMITVDGALYALRSESIEPLPTDTVTDDWYLATGVLEQNRRIVYVPEARGWEDAAASVSGEFVRKTRMVAGGFQTAVRRAGVLMNPLAQPAVAFMFLSHKLLRWLTGLWLVLLLAGSVILTGDSAWYTAMLWIQVVFYGLAVVGYLLRGHTSFPIVSVPYYFMAVNLAALIGFIRFLSRSQGVIWDRGRH